MSGRRKIVKEERPVSPREISRVPAFGPEPDAPRKRGRKPNPVVEEQVEVASDAPAEVVAPEPAAVPKVHVPKWIATKRFQCSIGGRLYRGETFVEIIVDPRDERELKDRGNIKPG